MHLFGGLMGLIAGVEVLVLIWLLGLKMTMRRHAQLIERGAPIGWTPNIPGWLVRFSDWKYRGA